MATEAQRLIGISLTKIAQSRAHRGGVSLHKNLLVATVLQKARYVFMEEACSMVHSGGYPFLGHVPQPTPTPVQQQTPPPQYEQPQNYDEDSLVGLTAEEGANTDLVAREPSDDSNFLNAPSCMRCGQPDKENTPPTPHATAQTTTTTTSSSELTYLDLDKTCSNNNNNNVLRERSNSSTCLKRRRAVAEWETEEAVLSILPKRSKSDAEDEGDDSVFLDEAALFSDCVAKEAEDEESVSTAESRLDETNNGGSGSSMEIERITSLVSIFSFGNLVSGDGGLGKLSRSVSTPDLCSAQAKESVDALQQRPFLAMTV